MMTSSSGCNPAPKPHGIRIRLKQPRDGRKAEEEVVDHTGEQLDDVNESNKEATLMEESSWSTSFKGLPSWSIAARRSGRKREPPTPSTGGDSNDNNAYENMNQPDHPPLPELESTSDNDTTINLDPLPDNEAHQSGDPAPNGDVGASAGTTEGIHACKNCSSSFSTHQALGGHMTSHRKHIGSDERSNARDDGHDGIDERSNARDDGHGGSDERSNARDDGHGGSDERSNARDDGHDGIDEGSNARDDGHGHGHGDGGDPKPHKCRVCSNAYGTGQQLGGHMRAHYKGILSSKRVKRRRSSDPDGSSSATATSEAPGDSNSNSSPPSVKNKDSYTAAASPTAAASSNSSAAASPTAAAAAAASSSAAAAGSASTKEKVLPRCFDLNELPGEVGDQSPAFSSSEETHSASTESTLDLTLSLSLYFGFR